MILFSDDFFAAAREAARNACDRAGRFHRLGRALGLLCMGTYLGLVLPSQAVAAQDDAEAAENVIMSLETAWNRGSMTDYLAQYEQDDSLRLTFGNTIVVGWDALNDLFRRSYPDPVRMGRFEIEEIETRLVDRDTAVVTGNFTHVFPSETIKGGFTHVLRRNSADKWLIVHERTSRGEVIASE